MNLQRREEIWEISASLRIMPLNGAADAIDELLAHIDTQEQTAAERVIASGGRGPTPDYTGEGSAWVPPVEARETKDPWESSKLDYDRSIHSNRDAKAWADFFVATYPGLADKHDIMLGWFANAMMAMHDSIKQASAFVVPELTPEWCDEIWRNAPRNVETWTVIEWVCKQDRERFRAIPADRVLGDENQFGVGFVEACGILAAKPFDRPALAAGLIREGGTISALAETTSDGPGISILREEMRADLDALRANQGGAAT